MSHEKDPAFKCNVCKKGFGAKHLLDAHSHVHSRLKPFVCDECGKGFRRKHYLAKHIRIHKG